MLNFTTTLSYGLRLMINLARQDFRPKQLKVIAREENIPLLYLRKIVPSLEKAGLIKSLKGPGGGFVLNRHPNKINLWEIIGLLSHSRILDCLTSSSSCRRYEDCLVRDLLKEVNRKVEEVFKGKTLRTIIRKENKNIRR